MATKKYKKLTNAEKKYRKELREELREQGLIPPVKPKLNRKKFLDETKEEFKSLNIFNDVQFLYEAISWMTPSDQQRGITSEQIGVLKMMKMAVDIKNYMEDKKRSGETNYAPSELYETVISPILKL